MQTPTPAWSCDGRELAQTLFEEAGDALFLFEPDTEQLLDVNPMAQRLSGYSRRELLARPVAYLFRSEAQGGVQRLRMAFKRTGLFHAQDGFLLRHRNEETWLPVNVTITRLHGEPHTLGLLAARDMREHREAQARVIRAEHRLHTVVTHAPVVLFAVDRSGCFTLSEGKGLETLGLQPRQMLGKSAFELYHDTPEIVQSIRRALAGESCTATLQVRSGIGAGLWYETHFAPLRDRAGQVDGAIGVSTDLTARIRSDEALRRSEERFRALVERGTEGIGLLDAAGVIQYLSPSTTRITGYAVSDLIGQTGMSLVHPDDFSRVEGLLAECLATPGKEVSVEYRFRHRDGLWRFIFGTAINRLDDPSVQAVVCNFRDVTASKQAEQAVRQSEARKAAILEAALDCILTIDAQGRILEFNPAAERTFGYRRDEVLGREMGELLVPPRFRDRHHEGMARYLATGDGPVLGRRLELSALHADGSEFPVELAVVPIRAGDQTFFTGYLRDITEQKRAEEALRTNEKKYRTLVENLDQCVFLKDRRLRFVAANGPFCRCLGRGEAEILGKSDLDFYPPHLAAKYRADDIVVLAEGKRLELEEENVVAGQTRIVRVVKTPVKDDYGEVIGVLGIFWDVTEGKRADEALARQRSLLRDLIDSIPDLIFYKDRDGVYLGCNAAFERYAGRREPELVGKTDFDLFPTEVAEFFRQKDREMFAEGRPRRNEEQLQYPDGRKAIVEVLKTPLRGFNGQVQGLIGVSRDVTDRKQLEEHLQQVGKMEAVGQLAGGVAHDFNNLLTAILGNLSLVGAVMAPADPNRELVATAEEAAQRAAQLTEQLLSFSRRSILRTEPIDLALTIKETVQLLRRTIDPRILVDVAAAPDAWLVEADPVQMQQVLLNLCLNARDAMPDGGRLRLETANEGLTEADLSIRLDARAGEFVRLSVIDTGEGIPPEVRSRIFEPFFTTKGPGKGTGLGLAVVFGNIKQHQGWVECASEVHIGTRFDIYLPRSRRCPVRADVPEPVGSVCGHETILVVDDEPTIRHLSKTILGNFGYRVLLAEGGEQALEVFARESASGGRPDLVLLDLTMPRLSGRDTLGRLRTIDPTVRVLLSSGYSADAAAIDEGGAAVTFIGKPYLPADLAAAVRAALDQPRGLKDLG